MSDQDGLKFCTNCKRDIPQANYVMHSMHCQRNLFLCTKCDEPIPLVELKSHNSTLHAMVKCPACGVNVEKMKMTEHEKSSCKHRAICCSFCHIETDANELQEHENYCGSRTEKCADCGEYIMLKYIQLHLDSNHGFINIDMWPDPDLGSTPARNKSAPSNGLLNDLSHNKKIPNFSPDPVRTLPAAYTEGSARKAQLPQNAKPDVYGRLRQWNDSESMGLPQSLRNSVQEKTTKSIDPIRTLPIRSVPDPARENLFRNPPDLVLESASRSVQDSLRGGSSRNKFQETVVPLAARNIQESVRPSAAGNRLSPSKRTNDMPQVNSATAVDIPKELHKPVIKQSESERLLASIAKPDLGHNPYLLANSMIENLDLGSDMVALPCEFCEAMIPANQLVIHETGCRPDLACFKNQTQVDATGDNNGLPCEFCGGLYPPHNLLAHQAHCELMTTRGTGVLVNEFNSVRTKDVNKMRIKQSNIVEGERLRRPTPLPLFNEAEEIWPTTVADDSPIVQRHTAPRSAPGRAALNGHQRQPTSTGAVPKQKAGTRSSLREINQEVSRSPTAPVTPRKYK